MFDTTLTRLAATGQQKARNPAGFATGAVLAGPSVVMAAGKAAWAQPAA